MRTWQEIMHFKILVSEVSGDFARASLGCCCSRLAFAEKRIGAILLGVGAILVLK
jgi:hypothetical protein